MSKKIVIVSAETSGDIQAAHFAKSIKKMSPDIVLFGVGGENLKNAGVELIFDSTKWGVIGIIEAMKKVPYLLWMVKKLKNRILKIKPDLLILIDSPAINMRLAWFAKENKIKVLYYFPPSAWNINSKKAEKIINLTDEIVPVFSFTAQAYNRLGYKVNYFGHPIVDLIKEDNHKEGVLEKLNLPKNKVIIGLLPGSRMQEVKYLLPVMLKACEIISKNNPDIFYVLPIANLILKELIKNFIKKTKLPIKLVDGSDAAAVKVMKIASVIITASGTATLEAAFHQTPMILLYKLHWFDWIAFKILIKGIPFAGLPNLISRKMIIPEFIQSEAKAKNIAKTVEHLLKDESEIKNMKAELKKVKESLGDPPVVDKVAKLALDMVNGQ